MGLQLTVELPRFNFADFMGLPAVHRGRSVSFPARAGVGEAVEVLISAAWLAIMALLIVRAISSAGFCRPRCSVTPAGSGAADRGHRSGARRGRQYRAMSGVFGRARLSGRRWRVFVR